MNVFEQVRTSVRVLSYVPVYEEVLPAQNDETPAVIVGMNPEKDFLPKTVFGLSLAALTIAERMRNRIPMNRIAQEISFLGRMDPPGIRISEGLRAEEQGSPP